MDSIEIDVEPDEVELAGGLMWAAGVEGIEEREHADGRRVLLIAGVLPEHTDAVAAALEPRWAVRRGVMQPELWIDSWRPYARAARVGDHLVVQPPWIEPIAQPGDTVISLDPGRAWGHGAHPSTLLVAEELVAAPLLDGRSVLDVGCGSGLLSIVAAQRGARPVVAIDIDPAAIEATLANALVNGVDDRIDVSTTPVGVVTGRYDVVVANIGLAVLVDLATVLSALVAPGGMLVLSGLLADQVDPAVAAYPELAETRRTELDGWAAVVLTAS
ncbi:MAG: 50S ribosomal protein L11 methyltransferase [Acidimicrobiales bacterium]